MNLQTTRLLSVSLVAMLAVAPVVLADVVKNDIENTGSNLISVGDETTIGFYIHLRGTCGTTSSNPTVLLVNVPAAVTIESGVNTANEFTLTGCGTAHKHNVVFSSLTPGNHAVTLTFARGSVVNTAPASFTLSVVGSTLPALEKPVLSGTPIGMIEFVASWDAENLRSGATYDYPVITATDNHDSILAVTCTPESGNFFPVGLTEVTCSATNAAGTTSESFFVFVGYEWSGFFAPLTANGKGLFRQGSTIPVKFQLTGASAGIPDAGVKIVVTKISSSTDGSQIQGETLALGDLGDTFRYDATNDQYIFNLGTKTATKGTWKISLDFGTGAAPLLNSEFGPSIEFALR